MPIIGHYCLIGASLIFVMLNFHSQHSSGHEAMPLNLNLSCFDFQVCHMALAKVSCESLFAQATFVNNFQMCHRLPLKCQNGTG